MARNTGPNHDRNGMLASLSPLYVADAAGLRLCEGPLPSARPLSLSLCYVCAASAESRMFRNAYPIRASTALQAAQQWDLTAVTID